MCWQLLEYNQFIHNYDVAKVKRGLVDYLVEIRNRLKKNGIVDNGFVEDFFRRHGDLTSDLHYAAGESPEHVEDSLQTIVEIAKQDYRHYFYTTETDAEGGEIRPKRNYKKKKKSQTSDAWERQESLARYLATKISPVGSTLVGKRLLSPEEAIAFLYSPLAAGYPPGFITHYGLDTILNAVVEEEAEDRRGPHRAVQIEGNFGARRVRIRPIGRKVGGPVFPGDRFEGLDFAGVGHTNKVSFVVHPHNSNERIAVRANSVLAQLNKAAAGSRDRHPISSEKNLWLILTGEFVPEPPVRIRWERASTPGWYRRARITLEVESWVTADEVADHYRYAQSQVLGKIPRSLDAKSLTLVDFVNQNKGKTWQELFDVWNKEHPVWRFKQVGHLHQQHKRAFQKLTDGN